MLKFALENGGDYVATGHYASLDKSGERTKAPALGQRERSELFSLHAL